MSKHAPWGDLTPWEFQRTYLTLSGVCETLGQANNIIGQPYWLSIESDHPRYNTIVRGSVTGVLVNSVRGLRIFFGPTRILIYTKEGPVWLYGVEMAFPIAKEEKWQVLVQEMQGQGETNCNHEPFVLAEPNITFRVLHAKED